MKESSAPLKTIITIAIAMVWFINGLFCKVLNFVPRHCMIVSRILGEQYSTLATHTIGFLEICMVVWILSGVKSRWCALLQIAIVGIMNTLEYILVPDLLLFGRFNALFAVIFMAVVYSNEFILHNTNGLRHAFTTRG
jgi:hypothetical protein